MNVFVRIGLWFEGRRSIKKVEFEERTRLIETTQGAQMLAIKELMSRVKRIEDFTHITR